MSRRPQRYAVAFISDRADLYLPGCIDSLKVDASPVAETVIDDRDHQLGMAGAVRAAWEWAIEQDVDYLFHVEEDFRFPETVDVSAMATVLSDRRELAQVVLKRQPWNDEEQRAGGIIEARPGAYTQRGATVDHYVEHELIFSLNPCLIPRAVLEMGWPDGNEAEFTQMCLDKGYKFAFYGKLADPPRCHHVGAQRSTGWRL